MNREIGVGTLAIFPEERWREGILYYLFGLWSGDVAVTMRPKITFGSVTLRLIPDPHALNPDIRVYCAYGIGFDMWSSGEGAFHTKREAHLSVGNGQDHVEVALVRFVKDDRIKVLTIHTGGGGIQLWKTPRRGEYRCMSVGLPETWEGCGPAPRS